MRTTDDAAVRQAAKDAVGNWTRFGSFAWHEQPDDAENWCIVYTSNRDSGLLDQSNAAAIEETMRPFTEAEPPDAYSERHSHWAVGYVDGYAIRVYGPDGEPTAAFRAWCELQESLADYPVLNEEDYSRREYEATLGNISEAGGYLARKEGWELPDGWEFDAFSWFWENDQSAVENRDDQGGYPSDEELRACFEALEYANEED